MLLLLLLLLLQVVLQVAFTLYGTGALKEKAGLVAHQYVVIIPFVYAAAYGTYYWLFDEAFLEVCERRTSALLPATPRFHTLALLA